MKWYLKVLQQYADFNGRARRREYWMFVLFNTLIVMILASIGVVFKSNSFYLNPFTVAFMLFCFILIVPSFAVTVRRLHDIGKSGWMLLIGFIPFIGKIWLLILMARDSDFGENKYGVNPK